MYKQVDALKSVIEISWENNGASACLLVAGLANDIIDGIRQCALNFFIYLSIIRDVQMFS